MHKLKKLQRKHNFRENKKKYYTSRAHIIWKQLGLMKYYDVAGNTHYFK